MPNAPVRPRCATCQDAGEIQIADWTDDEGKTGPVYASCPDRTCFFGNFRGFIAGLAKPADVSTGRLLGELLMHHQNTHPSGRVRPPMPLPARVDL